MMNIKKISVLTSLYRCESFLFCYFEALSAIEGKEQIEVLLLHNAPQEKELDIIAGHLPSFDFVRHIIIPEREGLYTTWNRGIRLAQGEYVTIWNVDDVRFPNSVLQQAEILDKNPQAAIAYGDIWISSSYGVCGSTKTNTPMYNEKKFFFKSYGMSCFQMWRKSIHDTIGYYDEQFKCVADFDFQIKAAIHFCFVKTANPLGIYLEEQPHKISANGLQELENNIVYLRYGVFEKINFFTLKHSLKKYRKDYLLQNNQWQLFSEQQPFGKIHKIFGMVAGLVHSIIQQLKKKLCSHF